MPDYESINRLTIFLASPGDLQEERQRAKTVVDFVNSTVGDESGWHVELLGWEDTLPGFSRPQELINADVDRCQLFVGLLWRLWGQPTGKGDYTSGFQEEFERAEKRHRESQSPDIWLFFKDIEQDQLADPGKQLKQVLAFRESQQAAKTLLYKEFKSPQDWENKFRVSLTKYVTRLAKEQRERAAAAEEELASAVLPVRTKAETSPPASQEQGAGEVHQPLEILTTVTAAIEKGELTLGGDSEWQLKDFEIYRLQLMATSLTAIRHTGEVLETHAINSLYRHRSHLQYSDVESRLLFRTIIGPHGNIKPGWYWFRDVSKNSCINLLLFFGSTDRNEEIRVSAVNLLSSTEVYSGQKKFKFLMEAALGHKEVSVRKAALNWLSVVGTERQLSFLKITQDDPDSEVRELTEAVRSSLYVKEDASQGLGLVLQSSGSPHPLLKGFLEKYSKHIDKEILI